MKTSSRLNRGPVGVRIKNSCLSGPCNLHLRPKRFRSWGLIDHQGRLGTPHTERAIPPPSRASRPSPVNTEVQTEMADPNATPAPEEPRGASATGQRAVAVGGPVSQSVIVTGDVTL